MKHEDRNCQVCNSLVCKVIPEKAISVKDTIETYTFRAWHIGDDTFSKQFVDIFSLCFNKKEISFSGFIHKIKNHPNIKKELQRRTICNVLIENNIILSQYIGREDKNGVEIYTGHIITCKYDNGKNCFNEEYYQIVFQNCCFTIAKIDNKYDTIDFNEFIEHINGIEVIGNIYENPELLESK